MALPIDGAPPHRTLRSVVFEKDLFTYAVLDGAGIPQLRRRLDEAGVDHICLYRGNLDPDLIDASPFLIRLEPAHPFTNLVLEGCWERNWGIFALSQVTRQELFTHLRRFLIVEDPEGKKIYFRYYDPRVLRVYLPTCLKEELDTFFGPIERLVMKDEESEAGLVFTTHSGQHSFVTSPDPVRDY